MRNKLDRRAELGDAEHDEYQASHNGRHDEAVDPVSLDDSVDDHDECAGRSADLDARSAESRDQESGDDRCVKTAVRRKTAGHCERDCEGKSNDADDYACNQVGRELRAGVPAQGRNGFRDEQEVSLAVRNNRKEQKVTAPS